MGTEGCLCGVGYTHVIGCHVWCVAFRVAGWFGDRFCATSYVLSLTFYILTICQTCLLSFTVLGSFPIARFSSLCPSLVPGTPCPVIEQKSLGAATLQRRDSGSVSLGRPPALGSPRVSLLSFSCLPKLETELGVWGTSVHIAQIYIASNGCRVLNSETTLGCGMHNLCSDKTLNPLCISLSPMKTMVPFT